MPTGGMRGATWYNPTAGLRVFETLGGVAAIQRHVDALGQYLFEQVVLALAGGAGCCRVAERAARRLASTARHGARLCGMLQTTCARLAANLAGQPAAPFQRQPTAGDLRRPRATRQVGVSAPGWPGRVLAAPAQPPG